MGCGHGASHTPAAGGAAPPPRAGRNAELELELRTLPTRRRPTSAAGASPASHRSGRVCCWLRAWTGPAASANRRRAAGRLGWATLAHDWTLRPPAPHPVAGTVQCCQPTSLPVVAWPELQAAERPSPPSLNAPHPTPSAHPRAYLRKQHRARPCRRDVAIGPDAGPLNAPGGDATGVYQHGSRWPFRRQAYSRPLPRDPSCPVPTLSACAACPGGANPRALVCTTTA